MEVLSESRRSKEPEFWVTMLITFAVYSRQKHYKTVPTTSGADFRGSMGAIEPNEACSHQQ